MQNNSNMDIYKFPEIKLETENSNEYNLYEKLYYCLSIIRLRRACCRRYGCPTCSALFPLKCPVILGPSDGIWLHYPSQRYKIKSAIIGHVGALLMAWHRDIES